MSATEFVVMRFYQSIGIQDPTDLSVKTVSKKINLNVYYWEFGSAIAEFNGIYKVFLNEFITPQQQWQDFGHEMSHYLHDQFDRRGLNRLHVEHRENKANYFAYHFCVPTFMLQKMKEVNADVVSQKFNVEFDFALRRLKMYEGKMMNARVYTKAW